MIGRRIAAVVLLGAVGLLGSVVLAPGIACACSCIALAPESVVERASAVVVGTPVAVEESGTRARYTVDVARSYKQAVPERITVSSPSTSAACGLSPELNVERVIVLAGPLEDTNPEAAPDADWHTTLCQNLGATEEILAHAGEPIAPTAADADDPGGLSAGARAGIVAGAVGGLLVLAAAGWLLVRRFR
ncbi:hypothetical protein GCM10022231_33410 [Gordonia caeni]|uniref:Serine/threonine protein kinase n=1 Tax=Gordonia caeni TaxID=1007097 RepID=A0ABP7PQW6_9ACTN